jgi:hypothetical protein
MTALINPFDALAAIGESQVGTQEDSAHTNRGAAILKYQQATSLDGQGWPWCAAFVDWCLAQFITQNPLATRVQRPRTPSAFGLITWAKQQSCLVWFPSADRTQPTRGDLVVYTFSHCGIVIASSRDIFYAVEGNTNTNGSADGYEVAKRPRSYADVQAFIHLPAAALPASVTLDPQKGTV